MSQQDIRHFSIVIPVHRDLARAEETLQDLLDFFGRETGDHRLEVILVLDEADTSRRQPPPLNGDCDPRVRILTSPLSLGKGDAIKLGVLASSADSIAIADADGSAPPDEVLRLLCLTNVADAVVGSRWIDGASIGRHQPWTRRFASRGFNGLVRLLLNLPLKDTQCGYKAFKAVPLKEVLPHVAVGDYGFDIDVLWQFYRRGLQVHETPLTWSHKDGSKVRLWKVIPMLGFALVGIRLANSALGNLIGKPRLAEMYRKVTTWPSS